jgi:hypothetical protein
MGVAFHTAYSPDGLLPNLTDRICIGSVSATYAGSASTATVAVTWTEPVPTPYIAIPCMKEAAVAFISSPTNTGFTLNVAALSGNLTGETVEIFLFS